MNAKKTKPVVVIVGGGIAGISTSYFLAAQGIKCIVIEKDSVGSHASGFAYGGLNPIAGTGIEGPIGLIAREGMKLHQQLNKSLQLTTGIDTEYQLKPTLSLAFNTYEERILKRNLNWQSQQDGFEVDWIDNSETLKMESRISNHIVGATYTQGTAEVEPYKFLIALAHASEKLGTQIRHGKVTGLLTSNNEVNAILLENGEIKCDQVVFAMGPWSSHISQWLEIPLNIRPLKGQIIRLRMPGNNFRYSIGWSKNYATTKPDGLIWAGTTEEDSVFDENPTTLGRDDIMASLLKMIPSLESAELIQQTACIRPFPPDELLIMGKLLGLEGAFIVTGAGRKGILLGPAMGKITSDLIVKGSSDIPIEPFSPNRFLD